MKLTRMIFLAAILFAMLSSMAISPKKPKVKKVDICITNLKQIGLGMHMYADDKKWFFPSGDNIEGIQKVIALYLRNNMKLLICPDDKERKAGEKNNLQEENSSYIYLDIERNINKIRRPSDTILIFDKPGNHKGFVNTLYVDGHVMKIKTNNNYSCEAILKVIYKNNFSDPIRKLQLKKARTMDKKFGWKAPKKQ